MSKKHQTLLKDEVSLLLRIAVEFGAGVLQMMLWKHTPELLIISIKRDSLKVQAFLLDVIIYGLKIINPS